MVKVLKRLHFPWGLAPSAPEPCKRCQLCLLKTNRSGFVQTFPLRFCWLKLWANVQFGFRVVCVVAAERLMRRNGSRYLFLFWWDIIVFILVIGFDLLPLNHQNKSNILLFLPGQLFCMEDLRTSVWTKLFAHRCLRRENWWKIITFAWIIFLSYIILWVSHFSPLSSFMWWT